MTLFAIVDVQQAQQHSLVIPQRNSTTKIAVASVNVQDQINVQEINNGMTANANVNVQHQLNQQAENVQTIRNSMMYHVLVVATTNL
jgi:hypothetical protein